MSRFAVTALFVAMTAATAVSVLESWREALTTPEARTWAVAGYTVLRFGVVAAFSFFVFMRPASKRPSRDPVALVACATAVAAVVVLQKPPEGAATALVVLGEVLALVSCVWLFVSVLTLGRCFGVLPEVRGLVREGPYRVIRHPVYLGELGACAGLVVAAPTAWNVGVAAVFAAAQAVRMRLEEEALAEEFPEYAEYAQGTPALFPRLARPRRARVWTGAA